jgi:hypothetical protein
MKKTVLMTLILLAGFTFSAFQSSPNHSVEKAIIKWENTSIELGKIEHNKPKQITFKFTNKGELPLVITRVKPSCGCTVASYPKEPIAPGETKEIKATYNASAKGVFNKVVTVYSNTDPEVQILRFTGEVI